MGSILQPGYVRWDGFKYVLDPSVEIVGPPGPTGPAGSAGATGPAGAAGANGNAMLVFRPGGTAAGNVYTTWASLWAARTINAQTIETPMTIVIDDSITSPATIETSGITYNFNKNTALVGFRNATDINFGGLPQANPTPHTQVPYLVVPDTVYISNPNYFENLLIDAINTANDGTFKAAAPFTTLDFTAKEVHFAPSSTSTGTTIVSPGGTVNLYGTTYFDWSDNDVSNLFLCNNNGGTSSTPVWTFNLYDSAIIPSSSVSTSTEGLGVANVNIYSGGAQWNAGPSVNTTNIVGGYFLGNWTSATPGMVLTKASSDTATWQTAGAGVTWAADLAGSTNTSQTVHAIQGVVISGSASSGKVLEASSSVAASWQTPPSSVIVENSGVGIINNPHTTLNFTGSGVSSVVDSGGGVATITISGGGGATDYPNLPGTGTNSFTSAGTIAEVVPTEIKFGYNTVYEVDSFVGTVNTTVNPPTYVTIATIAVPSTGAIDVTFTVLGEDTGVGSGTFLGIYRADYVFTAWNNGGTVSTLQPTSPANPLNVRTNNIGSNWGVEIIAGASSVTIDVGGAPSGGGNVRWTVIGQVQKA